MALWKIEFPRERRSAPGRHHGYLPLYSTCGISWNCGSGFKGGTFASPVQHPHELIPAANIASDATVKRLMRVFICMVEQI